MFIFEKKEGWPLKEKNERFSNLFLVINIRIVKGNIKDPLERNMLKYKKENKQGRFKWRDVLKTKDRSPLEEVKSSRYNGNEENALTVDANRFGTLCGGDEDIPNRQWLFSQ